MDTMPSCNFDRARRGLTNGEVSGCSRQAYRDARVRQLLYRGPCRITNTSSSQLYWPSCKCSDLRG